MLVDVANGGLVDCTVENPSWWRRIGSLRSSSCTLCTARIGMTPDSCSSPGTDLTFSGSLGSLRSVPPRWQEKEAELENFWDYSIICICIWSEKSQHVLVEWKLCSNGYQLKIWRLGLYGLCLNVKGDRDLQRLCSGLRGFKRYPVYLKRKITARPCWVKTLLEWRALQNRKRVKGKNNQPVDCAQWKVMECDGRKVVRENVAWLHSQMIRCKWCVMWSARNYFGENGFCIVCVKWFPRVRKG